MLGSSSARLRGKVSDMQYVYEFEMWRGEEQWLIEPFDISGITQGEDVADACESAADLLRETICDYLMRGEAPPLASFGNELTHDGVRVVVSVDASLDDVEKVSASKAAEMLGVSRGRITAMVQSGLLDGWKDGRNTWITLASVDARLASPRGAGRPKKAVSA